MTIPQIFNRLFGLKTEQRSAVLWDAAGGTGNRLANWNAVNSDFATLSNPSLLRTRARDSFRNNPWSRRAVELMSVGAVGAGIVPQLRMSDPERKQAAQLAFTTWTDAADFTGRYDFYGFQQAALRAAMVDGECIVRLVVDPEQRIPLQLQLLSSEYLDSAIVNSTTLNGIEYDQAGRRIAYHLFTKHPALVPDMISIRVPADQIIHLYSPIQAGQERGVSWLAPALLALKELQEFTEAALIKQKVSSLFCGYVTTADGSNPLNQTNATPALEPGSMVRLQAGETVEFSAPLDQGLSFEPFVRQQLRAISSALGVPYELLSGDVSQVTFASGRHSLLEFRRQLESIQHHFLVFQLCRPIWNAWTRLAVAAGVLPGAPQDYSDVRWIAPLPEMLDAKAEILATIQRVRAGFLSRSEAVSLTGLDAEVLDAEIAADNARADRLGLVYDSDPRRTTLQGQEQQGATNDAAAAA